MTDNNIHRANKRGMVLAIDMGNTNIVIGCIDDDKVYFVRETGNRSEKDRT